MEPGMQLPVAVGAGYLDSRTALAPVNLGSPVVVLDKFGRGHRGALSPAAELALSGSSDLALLRGRSADHPFDAVFHSAENASVDGSQVHVPAALHC